MFKKTKVTPFEGSLKEKKRKKETKFGKLFRKSFLSFRSFLSASFFIILTLAVFIESIPFIVTNINSNIIEQENVSEFHFSTIKTFFSEKFGAIKSSAKILKDDWDSRRIGYTDLIQNGTVGHDSTIWKFFSHLYHFNNTFCSIFFRDYRDNEWGSTYLGFDKIECELEGSNTNFCYRYWLQTDTDLTVYDMYSDDDIETNFGYKINISDVNKNLENFNVSTRSYFYSSIDQPNGVYGAPYGSAAGHVNLYYSIPIKTEPGHSDSDDDYVGVIKNNLSLEMVTSYLTSIINNGLVVVAEKNGNIVGSSDVAKIPYQYNDEEASTWYLVVDEKKFRLNIKDFVGDAGIRQVLSKIQFSDSAVPTKATFYNTQYILSVSPYIHDDLEWNILYFRSTWDVYGSLVISICVIIVVSMIISLVAAAVGYFLISFFVNYPISVLIRQMNEVEDFNFTFFTNKKISFIFEIAQLQKKFYFFAKALKKLISYLPAYVKDEKKLLGSSSENSDDVSNSSKSNSNTQTSLAKMSDSSSVLSSTTIDSELSYASTIGGDYSREKDLFRPVAVVNISLFLIDQDKFFSAFKELLTVVEQLVEECHGSILKFSETSIILGFNTFTVQNLHNGYQVMAGNFCLELKRYYMENTKISRVFLINFSIAVDGEAEIMTFGTKTNKTREISGNITKKVKLFTDVVSDICFRDKDDFLSISRDLKDKSYSHVPIIVADYSSIRSFPPNFIFVPYKFLVFPNINNDQFSPLLMLVEETNNITPENPQQKTRFGGFDEGRKMSPRLSSSNIQKSLDYDFMKEVLNGDKNIKDYNGENKALNELLVVFKMYKSCRNMDDFLNIFFKAYYEKRKKDRMEIDGDGCFSYCIDIVKYMHLKHKNKNNVNIKV